MLATFFGHAQATTDEIIATPRVAEKASKLTTLYPKGYRESSPTMLLCSPSTEPFRDYRTAVVHVLWARESCQEKGWLWCTVKADDKLTETHMDGLGLGL